MKKNYILALAIASGLALGYSNKAMAQEEESKLSIAVALNHDAFFGFNPMLSGAYAFSEKTAFTFYGIQWGAGTAIDWGNWTEFGVGVNFKAGEYFDINPQLGFTMGNLLSGFTEGRSSVGDGIVPNLTVNLGSEKLEGQLYVGYYAALRKEQPTTANYVHYWLNLGTKVSPIFSVGAHFENLFRSGGDGHAESTSQYYTWLGPYVQFSKGNAGLRFSAGANLANDDAKANYDGDFYRLSFFYNF